VSEGLASHAGSTKSHGSMHEVDLGEFTVTAYQPVSSSTLFISFHLYGSVTERQADEFTKRLDDNKHRIRDNIIVIVRSAEITDLTDAGLGLIKRRILETTNKALGKPLLQGVMFSEFSFVEQ
jgi:flagellar FliL protein